MDVSDNLYPFKTIEINFQSFVERPKFVIIICRWTFSLTIGSRYSNYKLCVSLILLARDVCITVIYND